IELDNAAINGHRISYNGRLWMAFRTNENKLTAFIGNDCAQISIDGNVYRFSEQPLSKIVFIPETTGDRTVYHVQVTGTGNVKLPISVGKTSSKIKMGKQTIPVKASFEGIELKVDDSISGKWLTIDI
ncbi:MAG: hypothetical protein ACP5D9_01125, partial [Mariniphaga sp.]